MLETYELLDRFELLYPDKTEISDLRRAYIDNDINSIFRLITDDNKENLRKLIMEDNIWSLWKLLDEYTDTHFVAAFKNLFVNSIEYNNDCFSRGQLQSKIWLVEELKKCNVNLGTIFLCAGWYATLATMLFESGIKIDKIRSFDIDPSCWKIAEIFNKLWVEDSWRFKASTVDIMDFVWTEVPAPSDGTIGNFYYDTDTGKKIIKMKDKPDTIINTSCEHLHDFKGWYNNIPSGKLIVIQANDYHEVEEHVNTYNTLEEFSASAPMTTVLYEGELKLPKYKRFMKIGFK